MNRRAPGWVKVICWLVIACALGAAGTALLVAGWGTFDAYDRVQTALAGADAVVPDPRGGLAPISVEALDSVGEVEEAKAYFVGAGRIERLSEPPRSEAADCMPGTQVNPGTPDVEHRLGDCIGMGSVNAIVRRGGANGKASRIEKPALLRGDLPNEADEVAVGTTFARDRGIEVNDILHLDFVPAEVARSIARGEQDIRSRTIPHQFKVTGLVLVPSDLRPPLGGGLRIVLLSAKFEAKHGAPLLYYPVHLVDLDQAKTMTGLRRALAGGRFAAAEAALLAAAEQEEAARAASGATRSAPADPAAQKAALDQQKQAADRMAALPLQIFDRAHQRERVVQFHQHVALRTGIAGVLLCLASLVIFARAPRAARLSQRRLAICAVLAGLAVVAGVWFLSPRIPFIGAVNDLGRAGVLRPSWPWPAVFGFLAALACEAVGHAHIAVRPARDTRREARNRRWPAAALLLITLASASGVSIWQWRLERSVRDPVDYAAPWSFHLGYTFVGSVPPAKMVQLTRSPGVREISTGTLVDVEVCRDGHSAVLPFFALDSVRGRLMPNLLSGKLPSPYELDAELPAEQLPPRTRTDAEADHWLCGAKRPTNPPEPDGLPQILLGAGAAQRLGIPEAGVGEVVYLSDSEKRRMPVHVAGIGSFPPLGETGWQGNVGYVEHRSLQAVFPSLATNFALINVDPRLRRQFVHHVVSTLGFGVPRESTTSPPPERLAAANTRGEEYALLLAAAVLVAALLWRLGRRGLALTGAMLVPGVIVGWGAVDIAWYIRRLDDGLDVASPHLTLRSLLWLAGALAALLLSDAVALARSRPYEPDVPAFDPWQ